MTSEVSSEAELELRKFLSYFENTQCLKIIQKVSCYNMANKERHNLFSFLTFLMRHFLVLLAHCDLGVCKYVLLLDGK